MVYKSMHIFSNWESETVLFALELCHCVFLLPSAFLNFNDVAFLSAHTLSTLLQFWACLFMFPSSV